MNAALAWPILLLISSPGSPLLFIQAPKYLCLFTNSNRAKICMQDLWKEKLKWDDPVNENLQLNFLRFRENVK